jgi:hypothetical protein
MSTTTRPTLLYADRVLTSRSNTPNGEVSRLTTFNYTQSPATPHIVSATYAGGSIVQGNLIGTLSGDVLKMVYHHVNDKGMVMTGRCTSTPEVLDDGRLRLHEEWEWTSGGVGKGESVVEEVENAETEREER